MVLYRLLSCGLNGMSIEMTSNVRVLYVWWTHLPASDWLYLQFTDEAVLSRPYGSVVGCMRSHAFLQWMYLWWETDVHIHLWQTKHTNQSWGSRNESNWKTLSALCIRPKSNFGFGSICVSVHVFVCLLLCVCVSLYVCLCMMCERERQQYAGVYN